MEQPFDLPAAIARRGDDIDAARACGLKRDNAVLRWRKRQAIPPPRRQVALAAWLGVEVGVVAAWCAENAPVRGRR